MRESIGGTWILSIVMTFLMLFTAYLAVSVNYAKAFRIKNNIISKIETMEINTAAGETSLDVIQSHSFEDDIRNYLTSQAYIVQGNCIDSNLLENYPGYNLVLKTSCNPSNDDLCGVCVFGQEAASLDSYGTKKYYYTVVDFFKFDLPIVGDLLTFKVKGNSKAI